jgi:hypothetical protein
MNRRLALALAVSFGIALALGTVTGLALAGSLGPSRADDTVPTTVSYQGQVLVDGEPYTGTGHFKFAIVNPVEDATYWSNDGSSTAGAEPATAVPLPVSGGLFAVLLGDVGAYANMTEPLSPTVFAEAGRSLHVWFDTDDSGPFIDLGLTAISAVPYALNAETLDGLDSGDFARASHTHPHEGYDNVIVVAKSGGDHVSIAKALEAAKDAGPDNRYLIWVAPGVYNGTAELIPYVTLQGAGSELTTMKSDASSSYPLAHATLILTRNMALKDISIIATGPGKEQFRAAILGRDIETGTCVIDNVLAAADDVSYTFGIFLDHASPLVRSSAVTASATVDGHAVYADASEVTIVYSSLSGQGDNAGYGVFGDEASIALRSSSASGTSPANGTGIYVQSSDLSVVDSTARGSGPDGLASGICQTSGTTSTIRGSEIQGPAQGIHLGSSIMTLSNSRVSGDERGIESISSGEIMTMTVDSCQVHGASYAVFINGVEAFIGGTLLGGWAGTSGPLSRFHCSSVYDADYAALDANCQ